MEKTERNKGKRLNQYVKDYVVFDLETTGINQARDAIIEISAVRVSGNEVTGEFSTLVNPGRHIPPAATAVNGITDEMVRDAPGIEEAIGEFLDFIGDQILVGHNIHTFDMNFAYDAAWNALGRQLRNDYIDTLYMARRYLPQLSHHRLTDVSDHFGIETKGAHRALCDCVMNQKCYEELGKLMREQQEEDRGKRRETGNDGELVCPECGNTMILRKGKFGAFYGCGGFPGCRYTMKAKTAGIRKSRTPQQADGVSSL